MYRSMVLSGACVLVFSFVTSAVKSQTVSSAPLAYWNFDDETAADLSGNDIHGTLNGTAGFSDDVPPQLGGGRSLELASGITAEGMGDYVDLGNPSILNFGTTDFTIAGWIKTDQEDRGNFFSNGGDDAGGVRYVLALGETGDPPGLVVLTTDDNSTKAQAVGTTSANDGMWHHIAAVREGTTIRVYRDGVEEDTNTVPDGYDLSGTSQKNAYIGVGRSQNSDAFIKQLGGLYDDVALWNVALPASDIAGLADGSLAVLSGGANILGDFNNDGMVTEADFFVLSDNLGRHLDDLAVGREHGDLNFDGRVDLDDFGRFKELFPGALGQAQGVPEPATIALIACTVAPLSLIAIRKRHRRDVA